MSEVPFSGRDYHVCSERLKQGVQESSNRFDELDEAKRIVRSAHRAVDAVGYILSNTSVICWLL